LAKKCTALVNVRKKKKKERYMQEKNLRKTEIWKVDTGRDVTEETGDG
jgi:hypothetical protein